ncbi:MAG: hypothetical protein ABWY93_02515 [Mycobacterium sp.]
MTGPNENDAGASSTRPISVAELLAKNGTIGAAPPGGGRRRRRRGNSDAVTVAELTGEIPILRTGSFPVIEVEPEPEAVQDTPEEPAATPEPSARANGSVKAEPKAEPAAEPEDRPTDLDDPVNRSVLAEAPTPRRGRDAAPERSEYPRPVRPKDEVEASSVAGAELMSPDPIIDESGDTGLDPELDETDDVVPASADDDDAEPDELGIGDATYLQSYLRSTSGPLYGGQTVADDLARRGSEDADLLVDDDAEVEEALDDEHRGDLKESATSGDPEDLSKGQLVVRGCWIAVQSIIAVAFGAGLFIAFDQLWKWNNIVALVLSVLVILGLVVGVRVVRKTEDIASTLIAVAVGALVTLGPLALLQSN